MHSLTLIRPVALLTATALLWSTSAIAQSTTTETEATAPATQTPAVPAPTVDTVVATVNGTEITLGEVIAVRQGLPEQYQELPDEVLLNGLVQQMADQILLENAAIADKLDQKPTVKLAIKNQTRAVLADSYMTDALIARVNEEAVAAAYKTQFQDAEPVAEVRAAHILVPEEAKAVEIKKLIDEGADFAAMAAEHGTDGTSARGGDLGWFAHDQMVPEFADAAFAMDPGAISDPVQTPFGWHLIKMEEKRDRPAPPLDDVRGEIINALSESASNAVVGELRNAAKIEMLTDAVSPAAIRADDLLAD